MLIIARLPDQLSLYQAAVIKKSLEEILQSYQDKFLTQAKRIIIKNIANIASGVNAG